MRFKLSVELLPPGAFGLSTDDTPVLRSGPTDSTGYSNKLVDIAKVEYGRKSQDRSTENAFRQTVSIGSVTVDIEANIADIHVDASDLYQAHEIAIRELDRFIGHLSLNCRQYFSYRQLSFESEEEETFPMPQAIQLKVYRYDLDRLTRHIKESEQYYSLDDDRLNRALQYFQLALFQVEERSQILPIKTTYERKGLREWYLSSAYLSLWKALASIVGDPSHDRDHQSRYKQLGLSYDFYRDRIQQMHMARNDLDVAHVTLDEDKIQQLESGFQEAIDTVALVLDQYRQYLTSKLGRC